MVYLYGHQLHGERQIEAGQHSDYDSKTVQDKDKHDGSTWLARYVSWQPAQMRLDYGRQAESGQHYVHDS